LAFADAIWLQCTVEMFVFSLDTLFWGDVYGLVAWDIGQFLWVVNNNHATITEAV